MLAHVLFDSQNDPMFVVLSAAMLMSLSWSSSMPRGLSGRLDRLALSCMMRIAGMILGSLLGMWWRCLVADAALLAERGTEEEQRGYNEVTLRGVNIYQKMVINIVQILELLLNSTVLLEKGDHTIRHALKIA